MVPHFRRNTLPHSPRYTFYTMKTEELSASEDFAPIYHATRLSHTLHRNSIKNPKLQIHTSLVLLNQREKQ